MRLRYGFWLRRELRLTFAFFPKTKGSEEFTVAGEECRLSCFGRTVLTIVLHSGNGIRRSCIVGSDTHSRKQKGEDERNRCEFHTNPQRQPFSVREMRHCKPRFGCVHKGSSLQNVPTLSAQPLQSIQKNFNFSTKILRKLSEVYKFLVFSGKRSFRGNEKHKIANRKIA